MGQFCWSINIWKQLKIWRGGWLGHGEGGGNFHDKTRRRPYFFNFQLEINNENQSHRPLKMLRYWSWSTNSQAINLLVKEFGAGIMLALNMTLKNDGRDKIIISIKITDEKNVCFFHHTNMIIIITKTLNTCHDQQPPQQSINRWSCYFHSK